MRALTNILRTYLTAVSVNKVMFWNEDGVGVVAINNGAENFLDRDVLAQMAAAISAANNDDGVSWIALTATGYQFFSAGIPWESLDYSYASVAEVLAAAKALFSVLLVSEKPVVAVLNGSAAGLGLALALLSDFAIAPPDVYLCHPEGSADLPLLAAAEAVLWRLPRHVAVELLTGSPLSAEDAARYGLVRLVDRKNLFGDAKALIRGLRMGKFARRQLAEWARRGVESMDSALLVPLMPILADEGRRREFIQLVKAARVKCASRYRP
nr:MAG: enoyl-CoA hydratase [Thermoproteus sp. AZ2]